MLSLILGIIIRIFSNSYLNVFQKILTNRSVAPSVVNFYTYSGLLIIGFIVSPNLIFNEKLFPNLIVMGFLGAIGNYLIIKALSCGELSSLAPINSYKPVVALIGGILLLNEIPDIKEIFGIILIILGTFLLAKSKLFYSKATVYRFLALIFSATEAIFIKKVILLSNISSAFFYWAVAGFIFSLFFVITSKHNLKLQKADIKLQGALILMVALMQYSTNYVFSKMNVAYALALFQLSTLLSVFLGVNIFNEKNLKKKLIGSIIMIFGAIILLLN